MFAKPSFSVLLLLALLPVVASVPTSCGTLSSDFALTADASSPGGTCFTISAPDVTLDCQGHSITGAFSSYGIYSDQPNTRILNCNFHDFETGIYFNGSTNGTISNTTSSGSIIGLQISGGQGNLISNSAFNATDFGLMIDSSDYNTISGTSVYGTNGGIYLSGSHHNTISNSNGASSTFFAGIFVEYSDYLTLINSTGSSIDASGINLDHGTGSIVINSTGTSMNEVGFIFSSLINNTISGVNATSSSGYGLYLVDGWGNSISNSSGSSSHGTGMALLSSRNNSLENLTITGSDDLTFNAPDAEWCNQSFSSIRGTNSKPILFFGNRRVNLSGIDASTIVLCNASDSSISDVNATNGGLFVLFTENSTFSGEFWNSTSNDSITSKSSSNNSMQDMQHVALSPGWNLVSFSLTPDDPSVRSVFAPIESSLDSVWSVEGYSGGVENWLDYSPSTGGLLQNVSPGRAYLVKINSASPLVLPVQGTRQRTAYPSPNSGPVPPFQVNLYQGWNMVGLYSDSSSLSIAEIIGYRPGEFYTLQNGNYVKVTGNAKISQGDGFLMYSPNDQFFWPNT